MLYTKKRKRRERATSQEQDIYDNVQESKELLDNAKEKMAQIEYILRAYSRSEL